MNPTLPQLPDSYLPLIAILAIWSLVIKGLALYRAGALKQKGWFVALFLVNSVGVLELIYLFAVAKRKK